jgi:hypothetical protein
MKGAENLLSGADRHVRLRSMTLASSEVLECGAIWLRYQVRNV